MTLLAGSITQRVSEVEVLTVPEPQFTQTWHPIGHKRLIEALDSSVKSASMLVLNREYSLSATGTKMFGVWQLTGSRSGQQDWAIGIRNSIDKSMTVGLVAGIHVFVCDNLVFSGDIVMLRKHTSGLTDDSLRQLCDNALGRVKHDLGNFENWFEALNDIHLFNPTESKFLTFEAMKTGALSPGKFNEIYSTFFSETGQYFADPQTLSNWHNAITHTYHQNSLFAVAKKNEKLTQLIDHWYGSRLPSLN